MNVTGFTFVEKPTDILKSEKGAVLLDVSKMIDETSTIIFQYRDRLGLPDYMNDNWDSLDEALEDTVWMKNDCIILVHDDLPRKLTRENLSLLLKVLSRAVYIHRQPLENGNPVRKKKVEFIVVFPTSARQEIEDLTREE